jgi:hypothetical protein
MDERGLSVAAAASDGSQWRVLICKYLLHLTCYALCFPLLVSSSLSFWQQKAESSNFQSSGVRASELSKPINQKLLKRLNSGVAREKVVLFEQ